MARRGSSALVELTQLLSPEAPRRGRVVHIGEASVRVATVRGPLSAAAPATLSLRVGDEVRLEGSTIVGKLRAREGLPVYNL